MKREKKLAGLRAFGTAMPAPKPKYHEVRMLDIFPLGDKHRAEACADDVILIPMGDKMSANVIRNNVRASVVQRHTLNHGNGVTWLLKQGSDTPSYLECKVCRLRITFGDFTQDWASHRFTRNEIHGLAGNKRTDVVVTTRYSQAEIRRELVHHAESVLKHHANNLEHDLYMDTQYIRCRQCPFIRVRHYGNPGED